MDENQVREYVAQAQIVADDHAFFIPAMDMERILASFEPYIKIAAAKQD